MFIKRNYPAGAMFRWTSRDVVKFFLIATIPVFLYTILNFKWLHLPWLPIALVGTAVAFIISFKNNASYDRLWEARKVWGGIVNTSRSFTFMVINYINNDHADNPASNKEFEEIRKVILNRHFAWLTAHRYSLRQSKPWEVFLRRKSNREYSKLYDVREWRIPLNEEIAQYLSEDEFKQVMTKKNIAAQILSLQAKHLRKLKKDGYIWEFSHLEMEGQLNELVALQGKNERIKNFPYPRQYATLNLFFVWIFIIMLPFGIMNEFERIGFKLLEFEWDFWYKNSRNYYELLAKNFVWLSIPFSMVISWVFHTMERVGESSENPFEGTANDVPITTMSRDIEIDILEMLDSPPESIPESIPVKYDIQI